MDRCIAKINLGKYNEYVCEEEADYLYYLGSGISFCRKHYDKIYYEIKRRIEEEGQRRDREAAEKIRRENSIYYFQRRDGFIKIGYSKQIEKRMKDLSKGHGELKFLGSHEGHSHEEWQVHTIFDKFHACGEWFYPSKKLLKHIYKLQNKDGYADKFVRFRLPYL